MNTLDRVRADLARAINARRWDRAACEAAYGRVWSTDELAADLEVLGFAAPFVVVVMKADGQRGSLLFQHEPRLYFEWAPDEGEQ